MTAQAWILELSRAGVGVRRVAVLAGLSTQTIQRAKRGASLRAATEAAILAVRPSLAKGQRITAYPSRRLLRALKSEGYTQAALARRLGLKTGRLRWNDRKITVRKALKVRALFERLTREAA